MAPIGYQFSYQSCLALTGRDEAGKLEQRGEKQWQEKCLCEPQLGKYGLYPTLSRKENYNKTNAITDFIAYADGKNDLFDISNLIHIPVDELIVIADELEQKGLIERI